MKRLIPLFIAVFTFNVVSAQLQKAPLVNYKMEAKSSSSFTPQNNSSSLTQPAPLWSDDCSDLLLGLLLILVFRLSIGTGLLMWMYNLKW